MIGHVRHLLRAQGRLQATTRPLQRQAVAQAYVVAETAGVTLPGTGPPSAEATGGAAPELLGEAADSFALVAAPVRVHLLWLLARGGEDVSRLAEHVGSTVPNGELLGRTDLPQPTTKAG